MHRHPPHLKIRRKPLPQESLSSPGNSPPSSSSFTSQTPILASPKNLDLPTPKEMTITPPKQTFFVVNKSLESVSLDKSSEGQSQPAPPISTIPPPKNSPPKSRPSPSRNGYSALENIQPPLNPFVDPRSETTDTFPLRTTSLANGPFCTKERWIVVICVVLLVIAFVTLIVGIVVSNSKAAKDLETGD